MNKKIERQLKKLEDMWFAIPDQEKTLWYLEKVGYHRLSPYFKISDTNIDKAISYYIFDKRLRFLILDMLEVIENAIKSIIINYIWESFSHNDRYMNKELYQDSTIINRQWIEENIAEKRLEFIHKKIEEWKSTDRKVKDFFIYNATSKLPDYIFFDKLTFWELVKTYKDLKLEHKKTIAEYFWINGMIFEDWIYSLKYLRNLCSHYENIFNKKMTISIRSELILELIWNQNTFISYFCILSVFNKLLIPNFDWWKKVIELMQKFSISSEQIWLDKKNLPSELESEAWEVLVNKVYTKHIIKSNLFEENIKYEK